MDQQERFNAAHDNVTVWVAAAAVNGTAQFWSASVKLWAYFT